MSFSQGAKRISSKNVNFLAEYFIIIVPLTNSYFSFQIMNDISQVVVNIGSGYGLLPDDTAITWTNVDCFMNLIHTKKFQWTFIQMFNFFIQWYAFDSTVY